MAHTLAYVECEQVGIACEPCSGSQPVAQQPRSSGLLRIPVQCGSKHIVLEGQRAWCIALLGENVWPNCPVVAVAVGHPKI